MSSAKLLKTDILIAGGGIIGLSIARALSTLPNKPRITVLEKDKNLGNHGSTLNSGVLHSGIYYTPGSFKARHCLIGNSLLTKYCLDNNLPLLQCGKLIAAKEDQDVAQVQELHERALANGVAVKLVDKQEALEIEPHLGSSLKFPMIWSPSTSVASPKAIFEQLLKDVQKIENVQILSGEGYGRLVSNSSSSNTIETTQKTLIETPKFINCGGLYADRIAHDFNEGLEYALIPLKGLYMIDEVPYKEYGLKTVIYPIPPLKTNNFLGVHTTLTTDGKLKLGPTAVPSFWREDYEGFKNFKLDEFLEIIGQYIRIGFSSKVFWYISLLWNEIKKSYMPYFIKEGRKLINVYDKGGNENPKFKAGKSAIRTQLINKKDFSFMNDFIIIDKGSHVHFLNMASPGWTSSMSLAEDMKRNIQENISFEEILKRANEERKKQQQQKS